MQPMPRSLLLSQQQQQQYLLLPWQMSAYQMLRLLL